MLRPDASRARIMWAAASLLLIVGVFVSLVQAGTAQRRRDAQATARAEATAEGVLMPLLTGGDLSRPVTDPRYSQLADQIEAAIVDAGPTAHVKVWRPDATITFSTQEDQVGTKVPGVRERLSLALDEGTQTIVDGGRFRTLVPIESRSGQRAVAELDEPYGPIWSGANWPWRTLAFVLGFATLVAIGILAASFRAARGGRERPETQRPAISEPTHAPAEAPAPAESPVHEEPRPASPLERLRPLAADAGRSDPHPDLAAEVEARRKAEERVLDAEGRAERAENELRLIEQEAKRIDDEREAAIAERDVIRDEVARLRAQLVRVESERRDADPAALEQAEASLKQAEELAQERVRLAEERAALAEAGNDDRVRAAEERAQAAEASAEAAEQRAGAAEAELSEVRSQTGAAETRLLEVQAELEAAQEGARLVEQARTEAQELIRDAESRVQAAEELAREADARAAAAEERIAAAQDGSAAAEQRAAAAEARAAAAEQRVEEIRAQDGAVAEETQRLRQLLTAAERTAETSEIERKELEEREATQQQQLSALRAQVTELQSQLARVPQPDPDVERRLREAEERATRAEERAAQAEQELIEIQVEGGVGEDERKDLAEAIAAAEERARAAEARVQEAEAQAESFADREAEFQREVARLHSELEAGGSAAGADAGAVQRAADLEEQLAMVRERLEASEAQAERLSRELQAPEATTQISPNGDGGDAEQMLRISQQRLAASAEALQQAEERAYEAEKELKRLKALEDEAEARFRQGKLEQALREMAGVEPAPEGPVLGDRRASGPFKAAVALDAKNSLASILGLVMTLKHKEATEEQQTLLRRLNQQARRLDHLVADLLDADRLARGEIQLVRRRTDLDALVRRVVDESGLAAERQITIQSESLTASVSAPRIEQILTTLLATVADRTKPGAKVWVVLERADEGVLLAVEDEHPASDAAVNPVVTRFADLHGGWAKVESREDGGSTFRVFLPDDAPQSSENGVDPEVNLTEDDPDAAAEVDTGRTKA